MTTTTARSNDTADNSVTFSLDELRKLEDQRVAAEQAVEARTHAERLEARRAAEAKQRETEAAEIAKAEKARAERLRAEAVERARLEARKQAEIDVARIAAQAKAKLDADNAERAHQIALAKIRADEGVRRVRNVLAAALGIVIAGASFGAYAGVSKVAKLEAAVLASDGSKTASGKELDVARHAALGTLDRRMNTLASRSAGLTGTTEARLAAERARLEAKSLDDGKLGALQAALDAWETRLDRELRVRALDRRRADLAAWAADRKHGDLLVGVDAARAKVDGGDAELQAYETALDRAREKLSESAERKGTIGKRPPVETDGGVPCAGPGDPLCKANGKLL